MDVFRLHETNGEYQEVPRDFESNLHQCSADVELHQHVIYLLSEQLKHLVYGASGVG